MNYKTFAGLVLATALPLQALAAGGHYPVDDVDVGEPGDFVIESWFTRIDGNNSEFAVLPTWRPGQAPLELVAGFIRAEEDGDTFNRFEPQMKWQFSPMAPGQLGSAIYIEAGIEDSDLNDLFMNFPLSFELNDAPLALHANIGWLHDRSGNDNVDRVFLGAGFEWGLADPVDLIGQIYREGADEHPEAQLGLRLAAGGVIEHFDIAAGRSLRGEQDWFLTVGLGLAF
jgi:hypothetical protein